METGWKPFLRLGDEGIPTVARGVLRKWYETLIHFPADAPHPDDVLSVPCYVGGKISGCRLYLAAAAFSYSSLSSPNFTATPLSIRVDN